MGRLGEFFLFNAMIALARDSYSNLGRPGTTSARLTSGAFESFPGTVVKPLRKKREYVNGVLARNEIASNAQYNRKLWQRVRHAHYFPNLGASIRVVGTAGEERWETLGARLRPAAASNGSEGRRQPLIEEMG